MLRSIPIAMPTSMTPANSWIAAFGVPSTKIAENARPSSTPLIAPERAAAAYPSRPVIVSTERRPCPTIAMSRAGMSPWISCDTACWAAGYVA